MNTDTLTEKLAADIATAANYKLATLGHAVEKTAGVMDSIKSLGSALGGIDPKTLAGYGLGGAARGALYGGGLGAAAGSLGGAIKGYRGSSGSIGDRLKAGLKGGARGGAKGGLLGAGAGAGLGALGGVGNVAYNAVNLPGTISKAKTQFNDIMGKGVANLSNEQRELASSLYGKIEQATNALNALPNQGFAQAFEQYSGIPAQQWGEKITNGWNSLKDKLQKVQPQGNI